MANPTKKPIIIYWAIASQIRQLNLTMFSLTSRPNSRENCPMGIGTMPQVPMRWLGPTRAMDTWRPLSPNSAIFLCGFDFFIILFRFKSSFRIGRGYFYIYFLLSCEAMSESFGEEEKEIIFLFSARSFFISFGT